ATAQPAPPRGGGPAAGGARARARGRRRGRGGGQQGEARAAAGGGGARGEPPSLDLWPVADAMWTDRAGVLLSVAAADCVPVLVAAREGPIGAAHAGWEGTSKGVTTALVSALVAAGADPHALAAAIGPSIGPCCYTIDEARAAMVRERGEGDHLLERDGAIVFDL